MSEADMSPSETVRALLDERGIEHVDADDGHTQQTWWSDGDHEISACNSGKRLAVYNLTPEQAIAATVGDKRLAFLEKKVRLQGDYIDKLTKEKNALFAQGCEAATRHAGQIDAMQRKLDAATVGNRTNLAKRLREVTGLHAFAELFGFDWTDDSDWSWHDVACAMADAIDVTVGAGTCHVKAVNKLGDSFGFSLSCGHSMVNPFDDRPDYCPWCGRRVIEEEAE